MLYVENVCQQYVIRDMLSKFFNAFLSIRDLMLWGDVGSFYTIHIESSMFILLGDITFIHRVCTLVLFIIFGRFHRFVACRKVLFGVVRLAIICICVTCNKRDMGFAWDIQEFRTGAWFMNGFSIGQDLWAVSVGQCFVLDIQ